MEHVIGQRNPVLGWRLRFDPFGYVGGFGSVNVGWKVIARGWTFCGKAGRDSASPVDSDYSRERVDFTDDGGRGHDKSLPSKVTIPPGAHLTSTHPTGVLI
jgi:hypothetical protein